MRRRLTREERKVRTLVDACYKAIELINKPRNEGVFLARAVLAAAITKVAA